MEPVNETFQTPGSIKNTGRFKDPSIDSKITLAKSMLLPLANSSITPSSSEAANDMPFSQLTQEGKYEEEQIATTSSTSSETEKEPPKKTKKAPKWKKAKDKPKRPLSAYNLFFADEREKLLHLKNKGESPVDSRGFGGMAKFIASKWNSLDKKERAHYQSRAGVEKKKYFAAVNLWKGKQEMEKAETVFVSKLEQHIQATLAFVQDEPNNLSSIAALGDSSLFRTSSTPIAFNHGYTTSKITKPMQKSWPGISVAPHSCDAMMNHKSFTEQVGTTMNTNTLDHHPKTNLMPDVLAEDEPFPLSVLSLSYDECSMMNNLVKSLDNESLDFVSSLAFD